MAGAKTVCCDKLVVCLPVDTGRNVDVIQFGHEGLKTDVDGSKYPLLEAFPLSNAFVRQCTMPSKTSDLSVHLIVDRLDDGF